MDINELAENLIKRRIEIDERSSKSYYRPNVPVDCDRSPTGDDYNDLFDAISDELRAALGDEQFKAINDRLVAEEKDRNR